ncbi:tachykinin-4 isoform X2 [Phyllostomus hastatus]|uniref:tachykinin-4 isoform X2 n=1 Tax=Phyllostomus hastatus TaxID=9423 RepID=UPI001E682755|nr:tachykinin-4 isoform X2 [Phyllostomus hastatus]
MLLCRTLLLLVGLSACAVAGDEEPALGGTEARSWLTVTLEEDVIPSIQLQLQEVQRGRVSQFFGLMGKRVGGVPPIQPARTNGASARTDGPGPPRQERTIHGRQRG